MDKLGSDIPPHGFQGFKSAVEAFADAVSNITFDFCIMRKGENYGWLGPISYAKRISVSNNVDILSEHVR